MVALLGSDDEEDHAWEWDTPSEMVLVTVLFVSIGLAAGGWYVLQHPYVDNRIYDLTHAEPNYSGGELVFTEGQRGMVNKVYSEVSDEYGWCLRIQDDGVEEVSHFASLEYTSEENISFSCFTDRFNGIMHTHPGRNGVARLSDQDEETLRETEWVEVSCIVASQVLDDRVNPPGFACFKVSDVEIVEVETMFIESRGG